MPKLERCFQVGFILLLFSMIASPRLAMAEFGDFNGDGDFDLYDYYGIQICMGFSGPGFQVPPSCLVFDETLDGDVDLADLRAFLERFSGSMGTIHVDAGNLLPIGAAYETYYSGNPGELSHNALDGFATQSGFTQDDFAYHWSVDSQPSNSGPVTLSNASRPTTAYRLQIPILPGEYVFRLTVTNLKTAESSSDTVSLPALGCSTDSDCDDEMSCTQDWCVDYKCVNHVRDCDDGLDCTVDYCGTDTGSCVHEDSCPDLQECDPQANACQSIPCTIDLECDDGLFCNGTERCLDLSCTTGCNPCGQFQDCNESTRICRPLVFETGTSDILFTLNTDNLFGTASANKFVATQISCTGSTTSFSSALQSIDMADGLGGEDILEARFDRPIPSGSTLSFAPRLSNIETLNVKSTNPLHLNATFTTGFNRINLTENAASVRITNLPRIPTLGVLDRSSGSLEIGFANPTTTGGSADELSLTFRESTLSTLSTTLHHSAGQNGFERLRIFSECCGDKTNSIGLIAMQSSLAKVICTGSAPLAIRKLPNSVTTIDGQNMAGGLALGNTGSTGAFNVANLTSIRTASGDDVVRFGDTFDNNDFVNDVCDLGENPVQVSDYDIVEIYLRGDLTNGSPFRNVEELQIGSFQPATVNLTGQTGLELIKVLLSEPVTLEGVPDSGGRFPNLWIGSGSVVDYQLQGATGPDDSISLLFGSGGPSPTVDSRGGGMITIQGVEHIAMTCYTSSVYQGCGGPARLVVPDLTDLKIDSVQRVTLEFLDSQGGKLKLVNAANVANGLKLTVSNVATGCLFLTSSGDDEITIADTSTGLGTTVMLGDGNDVFIADQNTPSADMIYGGSGDKSIMAGSGNNTITTGSGDDEITSGGGDDIIDSGAGNDLIFVGEGLNTITTGSGNDVVIMNSPPPITLYTITDFSVENPGDILRFDVVGLSLFSNGVIRSGGFSSLRATDDIFHLTGAGFPSDEAAETAIAADNDAEGVLVFLYFNTTDLTTHVLYDRLAQSDDTPALLIAKLTSINTQSAHDLLRTGHIDILPFGPSE